MEKIKDIGTLILFIISRPIYFIAYLIGGIGEAIVDGFKSGWKVGF